MVTVVDSRSSDPCVVFLGKALDSYRDSLHPVVQMGTSVFNARGNPAID